MRMKEVNTENFNKEVLEEKVPVVVDFWADWCHPCDVIKPHLERLAREYDGKIKFVALDVEKNSDIATKYEVMNLPTLLIFKDGRVYGALVGAYPYSKLKKEILSILGLL